MSEQDIRDMRKLDELAEKAGISGQQLSNIEKGRCAPSLKTINKILLALNARLRIEPL